MPLDLDEQQEWRNNANKMAQMTKIMWTELTAQFGSNELTDDLLKLWFAETLKPGLPTLPDFSALFGEMPEEEA